MIQPQINSERSDDNIIPLPLLFAKPRKDQVRISPLGTWIGYRARDLKSGVLNLWVTCRHDGSERQITYATDRDVCLIYWFSYDDKTLLYLREPHHGSELYHIYALDLHADKPAPRDLISDPNTTCAVGFVGGIQLWLDPEHPRYVYTSTSPCGIRSLCWSISRIDIDTGDCVVVERNPLSTWLGLLWFVIKSLISMALRTVGLPVEQHRAPAQWFPDQNMNFRGVLEVSVLDLSCAWKVRSASSKDWKTLHQVDWKDVNMSLVGSSGGSGTAYFDFSNDGDTVDLHLCNKADTTTFERFDIHTQTHQQQLACHLQSDITGFLLHPKTRAVQAVVYNYEKTTLVCLENCPASVKECVSFLKQQCDGSSFSIVSRTLDDQIWLVHVENDTGLPLCRGAPSGYFLLHVAKKRRLEFQASPRSELAPYQLGHMTPVHIPARDGEDLLCYLSTPPRSTEQPTPLVLLIHGGPQARDVWQYNPLCQLLCNRGMSVLQVNYRGSTGLGVRFVQLGMNGAFATQLQYDIQDAAQHAVQQEWCPPNRIAIMGGSFGGYCSLAAITFLSVDKQAPVYQCAVAICPCSVMGAANPHKAFYGNPVIASYWKQVYGTDISNNLQASQAVSPLFHMEKVRQPFLLLHGEDDPRVPIEQSRQLVKELQQSSVKSVSDKCEHIWFAGEGHGIRKEQNVLYMYHRIERFLCHCLELPMPPDLDETWVQGHTATVGSPQGENLLAGKDKRV